MATIDNPTVSLASAPSQLLIGTYDPTDLESDNINFIYSKMGKSYMDPLSTKFFYVAANKGNLVLNITYGNINSAVSLLCGGAYALLLPTLLYLAYMF